MNGCLHILLVEDDTNLGYLLQENLENKDFRITLAQTGTIGIEAISNTKFDLCILDVMLPGVDGFSIARQLKQKHNETPFIFLSARSLEQDKLQGFELGADDYITKPFGFKELYYRIMVILRRNITALPGPEDKIISSGHL